jgi:hypothetical protein
MPCFGVDVTPDRSFTSIAVAGWRYDQRIHLEIVDRRPGVDWVVERLQTLCRRWTPWPIVIDPASPAGSLLVDLAATRIRTETISTRDYAGACGAFYDAIGAHTIARLDQPVLNVAVSAARKRALGESWAWARKVGTDISPLVAVTLARYRLAKIGNIINPIQIL